MVDMWMLYALLVILIVLLIISAIYVTKTEKEKMTDGNE